MKLLYIDPYPVPGIQTAPLQILQNVDALAQHGIKVKLLTPSPLQPLSVKDILGRDLHANAELIHFTDFRQRWWYPSGSNFLFYRQVVKYLQQQHHFDAILIRNLKLAERLLRSHLSLPIFVETHEIFAQTYLEDHPILNRKNRKKYQNIVQRERFVYQTARGLIALTKSLAQDVRSHYQVSTPITVAPDGVDFTLSEQTVPVAKNTVPVALYLGSLHPWKGVETLIKAMPMTKQGVLWIAGGNKTRIQELEKLAHALKVDDRVTFLGLIAPLSRFQLIAQADVCLLPLSRTSIASHYTSPLKLFEYMAKSKPIIVADLPSIREVLTDEENALLVRADYPLAFAEAMNRLFADSLLRDRLGCAAGKLARRYSWADRVKMIVNLIEKIHASSL